MGVLSAHHPRCEARHPSDAIEHVWVELKLSLHVLAWCHCQTVDFLNQKQFETRSFKRKSFKSRFKAFLQATVFLPLAK